MNYASRHWAASRTLVSLINVPLQNNLPSVLFCRATWILKWFKYGAIKGVSRCKSHNERPIALFGNVCGIDSSACQSPCLWHCGRSAATSRCHLFDVNRLLFQSARISRRIRPSAGRLLLAKHHWVRIERWHRNESRIGNLAVPVLALEWGNISRTINWI